MIAATIGDWLSSLQVQIVIGAALWLLVGFFVHNRKARKYLTPGHVISTTLILAFVFFQQYQRSRKKKISQNFLRIFLESALYPLVSQVGYFLLLIPGSFFLHPAVIETINVGLWILLYVGAPIVLKM
jgi:positive regulator of sigma E activity